MAAAGEKEEEKLELAAEVCPMSHYEAGNFPKSIHIQFVARWLFASDAASPCWRVPHVDTRRSLNPTQADRHSLYKKRGCIMSAGELSIALVVVMLQCCSAATDTIR